jgi:hypothetical protein
MEDLHNKTWWRVRLTTCGALLWVALGATPGALNAADSTVALQVPLLVSRQTPSTEESGKVTSEVSAPQKEHAETSTLHRADVIETPTLRKNKHAQETGVVNPTGEAPNPNRGRNNGREPGSRPEARLRALMSAFGFGDVALQNVLVDYINTEAKARGRLRQKGIALFEALRSPDQPDAHVQDLVEAYEQATDAEKLRRRTAEDKLDEQVRFRTNPRLEAMLILFGFVGDNPVSVPFNSARAMYARRPARGTNFPPPLTGSMPGQRPLSAPAFANRDGVTALSADRAVQASAPNLPADMGVVALEEDAESRGPAREGRLVGVLAERREEGFDIRDRNGALYRFMPRWLGGLPEQGGGLDPEVLATMASLKPGDRVRVTWFLDDRLRAASLERVVTASAPAIATTPAPPTSVSSAVASTAPPLETPLPTNEVPAPSVAPPTMSAPTSQTETTEPDHREADSRAEMNETDDVEIEVQANAD